MAKEKKTISVLELPLYPEIWQADRINKKMENVARIYNQTRRYLLGQYRALTTRRDFKEASDLIYTLNDLTKNWSGDGGIKEFHEQRCKGYKLDNYKGIKVYMHLYYFTRVQRQAASCVYYQLFIL